MEETPKVGDNRTVWIYTCFNRKSTLAPDYIRDDVLRFHNDILVHGGAVHSTFGKHRFYMTQWKNRYIIEAVNEEGMKDFVYITEDETDWNGVDIFDEILPTFEIGINNEYKLTIVANDKTISYDEYAELAVNSGYTCIIL